MGKYENICVAFDIIEFLKINVQETFMSISLFLKTHIVIINLSLKNLSIKSLSNSIFVTNCEEQNYLRICIITLINFWNKNLKYSFQDTHISLVTLICSAAVTKARQFISNVFYLTIKDLINISIYMSISHEIDLMLVYDIYSWCYIWSS